MSSQRNYDYMPCGILLPAVLVGMIFVAGVAYGQRLSFGPALGLYAQSTSGVNHVGDVVIIADDQPEVDLTIGGFLAYRILDYLAVRAEINHVRAYTGFIVYDEAEQCLFCPVLKGTTIARNAFEFFPSVKYAIPLFGNRFSVNFIAGMAARFGLRAVQGDIHFNGHHPKVAAVINAMDEIPKRVVLYYNYGLAIDYRRFCLTGRFQESPARSIANDAIVDHQAFPFRLKDRYFNLGLSYSFYGLKRKKVSSE